MMSVKLATLESERTRTSGQSGDTLKYWWCEQPFCNYKCAFMSAMMFHLHEVHGVPMGAIGIGSTGGACLVSRLSS
jgi:hypothetical protein